VVKVREGDALELVMYPVVLAKGGCDKTYSLENKAVQMVLYRPSGDPLTVNPTISASDDTNRSDWMAKYTLPGTATAGQRGHWRAVLGVADDDITFGVLEFEVVHITAEVGWC